MSIKKRARTKPVRVFSSETLEQTATKWLDAVHAMRAGWPATEAVTVKNAHITTNEYVGGRKNPAAFVWSVSSTLADSTGSGVEITAKGYVRYYHKTAVVSGPAALVEVTGFTRQVFSRHTFIRGVVIRGAKLMRAILTADFDDHGGEIRKLMLPAIEERFGRVTALPNENPLVTEWIVTLKCPADLAALIRLYEEYRVKAAAV